jgi:capsular exopolysaccharide synthesis family protein
MDLPYSLQEAIRDVRTQLFLTPQASGVARTFAITSAKPGEGKTLIAGNLATAMAMAGRRVLLVDADLRRPRLHEMFNVPKSPGLSNVIAGENRPSEVLVESATKGLFILPAGADVPSPADLLDSERLEQLLQGFRQVFDVVVLDCPPVMAVTDASIVANAATSVVFVVSAGSTSPEVARAALDRLTSVKARIVGAVLNRADLSPRSEYHYGYKTANADV